MEKAIGNMVRFIYCEVRMMAHANDQNTAFYRE